MHPHLPFAGLWLQWEAFPILSEPQLSKGDRSQSLALFGEAMSRVSSVSTLRQYMLDVADDVIATSSAVTKLSRSTCEL